LAEIPDEIEEKNAMGVRRAAIRRLNYELGIPTTEIKPSELFYLTRIYYKATSDKQWGEHEIDYVFFLQKNKLTINPNIDEISEMKWVSRSEIENFVKLAEPLTPWFRLIFREKLLYWWDNLHNLREMQDLDNITTLSD
jgi:isopentenyl-diphosphate delta-isomerase